MPDAAVKDRIRDQNPKNAHKEIDASRHFSNPSKGKFLEVATVLAPFLSFVAGLSHGRPGPVGMRHHDSLQFWRAVGKRKGKILQIEEKTWIPSREFPDMEAVQNSRI
jgi:hypothetical protein